MAPRGRDGQPNAHSEIVMSVTWRVREVQNPALRQLAAVATIVLGAIMAPVGTIVAVLGLSLTAVLLPLSLPLHLVLRLLGRRGFIGVEGGRVRYAVERQGFREAR